MRTVLAAASTALLLAACGQGNAPSQNAASSGDQADTVTQPDTSTPAASTPPAPLPTTDPTSSPGEQGGTDDWRQVVTAADASSLSRLDQAWRMARAEADDKGFADDVTALGPLVDPNAGQAGRLQPAPGTYRCRTIKMGTKTEVGLAFNAYPFFQCSIELTPGGDLILTKTTGSQRTRGLLYPDTDRRWSSSGPRPGAWMKPAFLATARCRNATRSARSNASAPTAGAWSSLGRAWNRSWKFSNWCADRQTFVSRRS